MKKEIRIEAGLAVAWLAWHSEAGRALASGAPYAQALAEKVADLQGLLIENIQRALAEHGVTGYGATKGAHGAPCAVFPVDASGEEVILEDAQAAVGGISGKASMPKPGAPKPDARAEAQRVKARAAAERAMLEALRAMGGGAADGGC